MNPDIKERNFISSGSFGDVYKIVTKDDDVYALKVFKNLSDEEAVRKEINNLCKLQHRHVVRIYGCCLIGKFSMLMEFCPSNLKKAIQKGIKPYRAFRLFCEILEGIDYIHKQRMVHNDLKPDNIFLDHRDSVKIGDFGLARQCDYSQCRCSARGANLYLPPEALKSPSPVYSSKGDMYAIGIILFEMYANTISSPSDIQKLKSDSKKVASEMFSKIGEDISPIKYEIVSQLLSKYPEERPSAGHLMRSLKEKQSQHRTSTSDALHQFSRQGSSHHGSGSHGPGSSRGSSHHGSSHHGSSSHSSTMSISSQWLVAERKQANQRDREETQRLGLVLTALDQAYQRGREESQRLVAAKEQENQFLREESQRLAAEREEAYRRSREESKRLDAERKKEYQLWREESQRLVAEREEAYKRGREESQRLVAEREEAYQREREELQRLAAEREHRAREDSQDEMRRALMLLYICNRQ